MYKLYLLIPVLLSILGCSTNNHSSQERYIAINAVEDSKRVTLSHVKAYLAIGSISKAQAAYEKIAGVKTDPDTLITLAELNAANGDLIGAQQAFLLATESPSLSTRLVSIDLLEYFCKQKSWYALEAYGAAMEELSSEVKNKQIRVIGLCYFEKEEWSKANFWLSKIANEERVNPDIYLALAKTSMMANHYEDAQTYIEQYEASKVQVNAEDLWTAIEIYKRLKKPGRAFQLAENLRLMFPNWALQYQDSPIIEVEEPTNSQSKEFSQNSQDFKRKNTHIMKKGDTLYKLSKQYDVLVSDLLRWNSDIVVDDIPLGTKIIYLVK